MHRWGNRNISGRLQVLNVPPRYDFCELRKRLHRHELIRTVWLRKRCCLQTRNPLHRAHEELLRRATEEINGTLLLHPGWSY